MRKKKKEFNFSVVKHQNLLFSRINLLFLFPSAFSRSLFSFFILLLICYADEDSLSLLLPHHGLVLNEEAFEASIITLKWKRERNRFKGFIWVQHKKKGTRRLLRISLGGELTKSAAAWVTLIFPVVRKSVSSCHYYFLNDFPLTY